MKINTAEKALGNTETRSQQYRTLLCTTYAIVTCEIKIILK